MLPFKRCQSLDASAWKTDDIIFQATAWHVCDHEYGDDDYQDDIPQTADLTKYLVKVFGVTEDGNTVSVNLLDFPPYFFIKITHPISGVFIDKLREYVVTKLPYNLKHTLKTLKVMKKKDFWGFQNGTTWNFLRFTFTNLKGMRAAVRIFEKDIKIEGFHRAPARYKLYESAIEPVLRLIHTRNITSTGWIKIPKGYYVPNDDILKTNCQIDINCSWTCLQPVMLEKIAPIMIASFDLECTSSHGDFPVAKKDYKKVANDLYTYYKENIKTITKDDIVHELTSIFIQDDKSGKLAKTFPKFPPSSNDITKLSLRIKQNIDMIDSIINGKITFDPESKKFLPTKTELKRDDILNVLTERFNCIFPALEGDPIIQIGVTVHCYGDKEVAYKHIITLGTCSDIEGSVVEQCETEADLLMKFRDLMISLDPDIMTGYNIFGFDMSYLVDRADELNIRMPFLKIGRIKDYTCQYVEKNLSSSALGDNLLKYVDMEGRVLIDVMKVVQRDHKLDSYKLDNVANHFMKMNKNDVSPNDIFKLQKGTADDRRVIAEYCIQDCALCNKLIMKLEILANNIGMSNVCNVPLSYIFMRGQGIKIFSLVAEQCRKEEYCIPTLRKPYVKPGEIPDPEETTDDDGYEGAIVLDPKTGIYLDDPISVLDYASLYPSSMISENLSHDSIVLDSKYDNLPGYEYIDITYDVYEGTGDKKVKVGDKTCRFVQLPNGEKSVLPRILMKLLKARKDTRKKIEYETLSLSDGREISGLVSEIENTKIKIWRIDGTSDIVDASNVVSRRSTYDEFQKAVLDGLQLAYKVTANSLYGQCGAKTSSIYMKEVAASCTAVGRSQIIKARDFMLATYPGVEIIYGDTDSLFVKFPIKKDSNEVVDKKELVKRAWDMGCDASKRFKAYLKPPHDLEMEKVMYPMILLSKKRYCAYKYEGADAKPKLNSMGLVLKRRDNAGIVKTVYGGIIDIILNEHNIQESTAFLKKCLEDLINGKCDIKDLTITKSLKSTYKDPEKIAHKVLADRMKIRDPGNAPQTNDRIPFVYIQTPPLKKGEKILQGERIEHPEFIKKNNLKIDYEFYITNQIMSPVLQIYALALEGLDGYNKGSTYFSEMYEKILRDKEGDIKKAKERLQDLREQEVKRILFDPYLIKLDNKKKGNREITEFFSWVGK